MGRSELGIARSELARGRLDEAAEHLAEALNLPLSATHRAMLAEAQETLTVAQLERAAEVEMPPPPSSPTAVEEGESPTP